MLSSQNKNKLISLLEHKNYEAVGDSFIIFPDDVNLLGQIIKISNRFGIKIIPVGNGSSFGKDFKSSVNSVFLSTQRLNKIIDLDKSNMFIDIQSGCAWKQLFSDLAGQGLYFPVNNDSVDYKRTAGGIFSSLRPDSRASSYFTGVEFFAPDGTLMKYGCKTLKNVAGYDLVKFMSGSCGSYGIVTSLILRLFPSEQNFFRYENIEEICIKKRKYTDSEISKRLISELDPNSVFN